MTPEALKHIQTICRDWLAQVPGSREQHLTILPSDVLLETVEVELRSLMMPDNTTITSVVDVVTGAKYVAVLKEVGMEDVFIEASLDQIPKSINDKLLSPAPPVERNFEWVGHVFKTEPDPVNEQFPLIKVGDRVFVQDGWDLEERGYGIVRDILTGIAPFMTYLVEIDGKFSHESSYNLILLSDE